MQNSHSPFSRLCKDFREASVATNLSLKTFISARRSLLSVLISFMSLLIISSFTIIAVVFAAVSLASARSSLISSSASFFWLRFLFHALRWLSSRRWQRLVMKSQCSYYSPFPGDCWRNSSGRLIQEMQGFWDRVNIQNRHSAHFPTSLHFSLHFSICLLQIPSWICRHLKLFSFITSASPQAPDTDPL